MNPAASPGSPGVCLIGRIGTFVLISPCQVCWTITLGSPQEGSTMKLIALIIGLMTGSLSFALAQSTTSGGNQNASSVGGTAGTNVGGTIHTNQGNAYGNSATGSPTEGQSRNGQPAESRAAGPAKEDAGKGK